MPFSPIAHTAIFRRTSIAHGEESEILASPPAAPHSALPGMQPSASTSWINPFSRASFSVDRDNESYIAPESLPSSRRPSAATIISSLLHLPSKDLYPAGQDGYVSSDDAGSSSGSIRKQTPATAATAGRRPSIFKAWKNRRASQSTQGSAPAAMATSTSSPNGFAPTSGRRRSSALPRVLQPSALRNNTSARVEEHLSTSDESSDPRRRSLSIVCRGERASDELDPMERFSPPPSATRSGHGVTAAMAIRDTWLYGSHQWTQDGRKGSVSTLATSTNSNYAAAAAAAAGKMVGRKSISHPTAIGLDIENQQLQHDDLHQRQRPSRHNGSRRDHSDDTASVVSLSLTEEIALYTSDVQTVEANAGRARRSANSSGEQPPNAAQHVGSRSHSAAASSASRSSSSRYDASGAFVWNLPEWSSTATRGMSVSGTRLPELSPAPAVMIADPFSRLSLPHQQAQAHREMVDGEQESAVEMQRIESGHLDPVLSPFPAHSPTTARTPTSDVAASDGHGARLQPGTSGGGVQWEQPQWNAASPFRPDAPLPSLPPPGSHRPSMAAPGSSYHSAEDQSPTSAYFPPTINQPPSPTTGGKEDFRRRATTYFDASSLPVVEELPASPSTELAPTTTTTTTTTVLIPPRSPHSPKSPKSFGYSEESFEMRMARRRTSYSLPRPPPGYEQMVANASAAASRRSTYDDEDERSSSNHVPTPRLMSAGYETSSPMSSSFEPETPNNVSAIFPGNISSGDVTSKRSGRLASGGKVAEKEVREEEEEEEEEEGGEDLHAQFCSVLLLDMGDGTAIPMSPSPGIEARPDPFTLLAH